MTAPAAVLATLRRFLLAIVGLGLLGTGTELLLMGHDEDPWQLIPLVGVGFAADVHGQVGKGLVDPNVAAEKDLPRRSESTSVPRKSRDCGGT